MDRVVTRAGVGMLPSTFLICPPPFFIALTAVRTLRPEGLLFFSVAAKVKLTRVPILQNASINPTFLCSESYIPPPSETRPKFMERFRTLGDILVLVLNRALLGGQNVLIPTRPMSKV